MKSEFLAAVTALRKTNEDFAHGHISPVQHRDLRERALSTSLLGFAEENGVRLEGPLYFDSRGEFRVVAKAGVDGKVGFGKDLADALTRHNARCGIAAGAHMLPDSSWCYLNHFDAEKLVLEQAALAQDSVTQD